MKRVFQLEELECANCAAKMEAAIGKLDGVESASVNFLTQKLILSADDQRFDGIVEQAKKIISKIEPACRLLA